jgi:hypothetical protein
MLISRIGAYAMNGLLMVLLMSVISLRWQEGSFAGAAKKSASKSGSSEKRSDG